MLARERTGPKAAPMGTGSWGTPVRTDSNPEVRSSRLTVEWATTK